MTRKEKGMAFLHPSTGCSQCHTRGQCHIHLREAGPSLMWLPMNSKTEKLSPPPTSHVSIHCIEVIKLQGLTWCH